MTGEMTEDVDIAEIEQRVRQFQHMELPGQPMGMHMGTSYLINDLWRSLKKTREERDAARALLREIRDFVVDEPMIDPNDHDEILAIIAKELKYGEAT